MKTTVEKVYVEVVDDDKVKRKAYPIRTSEGKLMTQRLRRLISNEIQQVFTQHEVTCMGMVWKRPCRLLEEIIEDRFRLQHELFMLEGISDLTEARKNLVSLEAAEDFEISLAIWYELDLRKSIKQRIRELDFIVATCNAESKIPVPYSW